MNLKIECPACSRQFQVSEDLSGKTVECGACDKRFRVEDQVIVKEKKRIYPGENKDALLDRLGRSPVKSAQPVNFQQANYVQNSKPEGAVPPKAGYSIAAGFGIVLILIYAFIFFTGTAASATMYADVSMLQRFVLAAFVGLLGFGLIVFGARNWRRSGIFLGLLLSGGLLALVATREVRLTPSLESDFSAEDASETAAVPAKNSAADMASELRLKPIEDALAAARNSGAAAPEKSVAGIYINDMRERHELPIMEFLRRQLAIPDSQTPVFFPRGDTAQLVLVEGLMVSYDEVYGAVSRIGRAKSYPELHLIVVDLDPNTFSEPNRELFDKLIDPQNPVFFKSNLDELSQVGIDRVKKAITRLANVPEEIELLFRPEITDKLVELLENEPDKELRIELSRALKKWGQGNSAAAAKVLSKVDSWLNAKLEIPKDIVDFVVENKTDGAVELVDTLWQREPLVWRDQYQDLGPMAEERLLEYVKGTDENLKLEAIKILHHVGTSKSIPFLEKIEANGNQQFQIYVTNAIAAIRKRSK